MITSALVVEILIIGYQVLICIILIFLDFSGFKINILSSIKENPVISILTFTFLAYSVGIIFDSFIAWFFEKAGLDQELFHRRDGKNMIDILYKHPETHKFLDNLYARYRIVRATLFNLPIITLILTLSIIFVYKNNNINSLALGSIVFIIGSLLTLLTFHAWRARLKSYKKYLDKAFELCE
jgi:hypothetical protein